LGSIAFDGYPQSDEQPGGVPTAILQATTELEFRNAVLDLLTRRDDATIPPQSWPWPWETSWGTDYAYSFFPAVQGRPGRVIVLGGGDYPEELGLFPKMDTSRCFGEDHSRTGFTVINRDAATGRAYLH
jgi:hypothetical protein